MLALCSDHWSEVLLQSTAFRHSAVMKQNGMGLGTEALIIDFQLQHSETKSGNIYGTSAFLAKNPTCVGYTLNQPHGHHNI